MVRSQQLHWVCTASWTKKTNWVVSSLDHTTTCVPAIKIGKEAGIDHAITAMARTNVNHSATGGLGNPVKMFAKEMSATMDRMMHCGVMGCDQM